MSREQTNTDAERPRPTRAQRLAALGFLAAFALTIITVLWTFHALRSTGAEPAAVEDTTHGIGGGETPPVPKR